jgi:hypothetical protein
MLCKSGAYDNFKQHQTFKRFRTITLIQNLTFMKKTFFAVATLLTFALFTGCDNDDLPKGTPNCIADKIEVFKTESCEQDAKVVRYDFQNKKVYLFDEGTCGADLQTKVYDEACLEICALGGIAGVTECQGVEFAANAKNPVVIWERQN